MNRKLKTEQKIANKFDETDGDMNRELMDIERGEFNKIKYSKNLKQKKKAKSKGGRGYSPDWYLAGRVNACGYRQSEAKFIDYPVNDIMKIKHYRVF